MQIRGNACAVHEIRIDTWQVSISALKKHTEVIGIVLARLWSSPLRLPPCHHQDQLVPALAPAQERHCYLVFPLHAPYWPLPQGPRQEQAPHASGHPHALKWHPAEPAQQPKMSAMHLRGPGAHQPMRGGETRES